MLVPEASSPSDGVLRHPRVPLREVRLDLSDIREASISRGDAALEGIEHLAFDERRVVDSDDAEDGVGMFGSEYPRIARAE